MIEFPLTKANRLRLAQAFCHNRRVDVSIDCVIEGQMGQAFVDDLERPSAFMLNAAGFHYFAGDAASDGGREMLAALPLYTLFMPPPLPWVKAAQGMYGERLVSFPRYSFSSEKLSLQHLHDLLQASPWREAVRRLDAELVTAVSRSDDNICDIDAFDSAADFVERGIGYCLLDGEMMVGVAYSSLVAGQGIEVSIVVLPDYRRQGVATALAAALLLYCLEHDMNANWDAANPASCRLAEKLGYVQTGSYEAYYLQE